MSAVVKTGSSAMKQMGRVFIVLVIFTGIMIVVRRFALKKSWEDSI